MRNYFNVLAFSFFYFDYLNLLNRFLLFDYFICISLFFPLNNYELLNHLYHLTLSLLWFFCRVWLIYICESFSFCRVWYLYNIESFILFDSFAIMILLWFLISYLFLNHLYFVILFPTMTNLYFMNHLPFMIN